MFAQFSNHGALGFAACFDVFLLCWAFSIAWSVFNIASSLTLSSIMDRTDAHGSGGRDNAAQIAPQVQLAEDLKGKGGRPASG